MKKTDRYYVEMNPDPEMQWQIVDRNANSAIALFIDRDLAEFTTEVLNKNNKG